MGNLWFGPVREVEIFKIPFHIPNIHPIPLLASPLKVEESSSLPFKGRVGVGMGVASAA